MRHLTRADYLAMPWANGRGTTLELARADGPDGMEWRLSIASVVEDGAFSRFPGVDRVLTVLDGPGFRLHGSGLLLEALPLAPVAFPGDVAIAAVGVTAPCTDFNVMVARGLTRAEVTHLGAVKVGPGALVFVLALEGGTIGVNGTAHAVQALDLMRLDAGDSAEPQCRHIRVGLFRTGRLDLPLR